MPPIPGETILNQMKRSNKAQQTRVLTAAGQQLAPYAESRVALIISSHPTSLQTLSLTQDVGAGLGITIPAAGAALTLTLAQHGSIVKGPIFMADGTFPLSATYMESLNDAP